MSDFDRNPRRQQELRGRPFADAVYCDCLGATAVNRFERDDGEAHVLDQTFAIDAEIVLPTGQKLTCQEKFLSHQFAQYNSVTFEYMQDPGSGEQGDWFRLCAEVYFVAYFDAAQAGFLKWALLDVPLLKILTAEGRVHWTDRQNNKGGARASFRYTDVGKLPAGCVLFQQGFQEALCISPTDPASLRSPSPPFSAPVPRFE